MKKGFYYIVALLTVLLLWSCSTKKNTKASRFYHAFTTRYNIYFNGKQAFDEALKSQQDGYKENYSDRIYMYPISAQPKDKAEPGGPFDRTIENNGLKETAARLRKGIIAFSPLAQGLLTNRYLNGIPEDSRIRTDGRFLKKEALTEERIQQIRSLNGIAAGRGQTLAEMALSWVLRDGIVTSVLVGASRPEQVLDDIRAIENIEFSQEELAKIDSVILSDL